MATSTQVEVGRNEPCPCGSGKKYKACCAGRASPAAAEAKAFSWGAVALIAVGVAVAGGVVFQLRRPAADAPPESLSIPIQVPGAAGGAPLTSSPMAQPPGEAPPGKVWSPEHGHWHDAIDAGPFTTTITPGMDGQTAPAGSAALTPAPPGEAPPGKVWSPEHGHWHDAVDAGPFTTTITPQAGSPAEAPPGPPPEGKVWSAEHGHWHDAPPGGAPPEPE